MPPLHRIATVPGLRAVHLSPRQTRVGLCVEGPIEGLSMIMTLAGPLATLPVRCSNSNSDPGSITGAVWPVGRSRSAHGQCGTTWSQRMRQCDRPCGRKDWGRENFFASVDEGANKRLREHSSPIFAVHNGGFLSSDRPRWSGPVLTTRSGGSAGCIDT